jgi:hypothetical protein
MKQKAPYIFIIWPMAIFSGNLSLSFIFFIIKALKGNTISLDEKKGRCGFIDVLGLYCK